MVTNSIFVKGDFVTVDTCPSHSPAAGGKPDTDILSSPTCWCKGRVQRIFFDDSILVTGKGGYLCAFGPNEVAMQRFGP